LRPTFRRTGPILFAGSLRHTATTGKAVAMPRQAVHDTIAAHRTAKTPCQVMFDEDVNVASLRSALPQARVSELMGHGIVVAGRPDPNGIAFGDAGDEQLFAADVLDLDLSGQMVVLGACGLANNPRRRGGETWAPSLAGAMLGAGAHSVLAATTEIELHRHLAAMVAINRRLALEESLSQALLHARQSAASPRAALELLLMQVQGRGH
jgi:CHAT domain-containing protein